MRACTWPATGHGALEADNWARVRNADRRRLPRRRSGGSGSAAGTAPRLRPLRRHHGMKELGSPVTKFLGQPRIFWWFPKSQAPTGPYPSLSERQARIVVLYCSLPWGSTHDCINRSLSMQDLYELRGSVGTQECSLVPMHLVGVSPPILFRSGVPS